MKYLSLIIILSILSACKKLDLERSNPYDTKNPAYVVPITTLAFETEPYISHNTTQDNKLSAGEDFTVSFYLKNTGEIEIEDLLITASDLSDKIHFSQKTSIGTLEPGDKRIVNFKFKVPQYVPDSLDVPLVISAYNDDDIVKLDTLILHVGKINAKVELASVVVHDKLSTCYSGKFEIFYKNMGPDNLKGLWLDFKPKFYKSYLTVSAYKVNSDSILKSGQTHSSIANVWCSCSLPRNSEVVFEVFVTDEYGNAFFLGEVTTKTE